MYLNCSSSQPVPITCIQLSSSRLVTTHSISPRTSFYGAPCSIRHRSSPGVSAQRYTYCTSDAPKHQILCFQEDCVPRDKLAKVSATNIRLNDNSPVLSLHILPKADGTHDPISHLLLAVHKNGVLSCYRQDLKSELWSRSLSTSLLKANKGVNIHYATILSKADALKSILKHREDITEASNNDNESCFLLTLLSPVPSHDSNHKPYDVHLDLRRIDISRQDGNTLVEIGSQRLPSPQILQQVSESKFSCHVPSGRLYQQGEKAVALYVLESFTPQLVQVVQPRRRRFDSIFHVSPSLVATASEGSIELLGTKFGSLLATRSLNTLPSRRRSPSNKTSDPDAKAQRPIQFVAFSSRHRLLTALVGQQLVNIPISPSSSTKLPSAQKHDRDGLLIGSLGRDFNRMPNSSPRNGPSPGILSNHDDNTEPTDAWYHRRNYLCKMLENDGFHAFAKAMSIDLRLEGKSESPIDPIKLDFFLSRTFNITKSSNGEAEDDGLQLAFWSETIHGKALSLGFLTKERIEAALKSYGNLHLTTKILPTSLVDSIGQFDPSGRILKQLLLYTRTFSPIELAHVLLFVVRRLNASREQGQPKLLTDGEPETSPHPAQESDINGIIDPMDSTQTPGDRDSTTEPAIDALYLVLRKLKRIPSNLISQNLRRTFNTSELRGLIDTLRVELAGNGWLALCAEAPTEPRKENASEDQMSVISHTLNSILDALGPTGWMLGNHTGYEVEESANTLSYLQAEISAALEGIEEAAYLQRVLHEMLICGKESLEPPRKALKYTEKEGVALDLVKPKIMVLGEESKLLPLGLKPTKTVSKTKIAAGGELKFRSARDMGRMISRNVGPYSFERIEI